jgi:NAD(P)-dependent dehydrogenase (short-subunit alcohol dehydrogenase family)
MYAAGDVRTLRRGDVVVMPFAFSDGTCAFCDEGLHTACEHVGFVGNNGINGAQAEALRVPYADGTLFALPVGEDDALMPSLLTLVGVPDRAAYHATKHGVIGLTKSSALGYAARGIRINAICPGIVDTPMVAAMKEGESEAMDELMAAVPIKRLGRRDEIASAVLWLSGPGSTFVVAHALVVDGGYTVP